MHMVFALSNKRSVILKLNRIYFPAGHSHDFIPENQLHSQLFYPNSETRGMPPGTCSSRCMGWLLPQPGSSPFRKQLISPDKWHLHQKCSTAPTSIHSFELEHTNDWWWRWWRRMPRDLCNLKLLFSFNLPSAEATRSGPTSATYEFNHKVLN